MSEIAPYLAIAGSLVGMGTSIYGLSQTPSIPSFQTFQIPSADLTAINTQIQANTQLSDEARTTAMNALNSYNAGQLSSAYSGAYQAAYDQQLAALQQQLAAQGFTPGSTQWNSAMQSFQLWAGQLKSQYLQSQLSDALNTAGLSNTAINDYLQSWSAQAGVSGQAGQTTYQGALANIMGANLTQSQLGNLGTATGKLTASLGNIMGGPTSNVPATLPGLTGAGLGAPSTVGSSGSWTYPGGSSVSDIMGSP